MHPITIIRANAAFQVSLLSFFALLTIQNWPESGTVGRLFDVGLTALLIWLPIVDYRDAMKNIDKGMSHLLRHNTIGWNIFELSLVAYAALIVVQAFKSADGIMFALFAISGAMILTSFIARAFLKFTASRQVT